MTTEPKRKRGRPKKTKIEVPVESIQEEPKVVLNEVYGGEIYFDNRIYKQHVAMFLYKMPLAEFSMALLAAHPPNWEMFKTSIEAGIYSILDKTTETTRNFVRNEHPQQWIDNIEQLNMTYPNGIYSVERVFKRYEA